MKKTFSILVVILSLFLTSSTFAGEDLKLGNDFTLTEKTKISEILSDPENFIGKRVLIEGEIVAVCAVSGCWMELKSDDEHGKIKIKVKDGEIVFPVEASGKTAIVEGELYKMELDEESARNYMEHLADDAGVEFDPSTVTGPMTIYQIKGLGALIKNME
jgi:hypothetical protein